MDSSEVASRYLRFWERKEAVLQSIKTNKSAKDFFTALDAYAAAEANDFSDTPKSKTAIIKRRKAVLSKGTNVQSSLLCLILRHGADLILNGVVSEIFNNDPEDYANAIKPLLVVPMIQEHQLAELQTGRPTVDIENRIPRSSDTDMIRRANLAAMLREIAGAGSDVVFQWFVTYIVKGENLTELAFGADEHGRTALHTALLGSNFKVIGPLFELVGSDWPTSFVTSMAGGDQCQAPILRWAAVCDVAEARKLIFTSVSGQTILEDASVKGAHIPPAIVVLAALADPDEAEFICSHVLEKLETVPQDLSPLLRRVFAEAANSGNLKVLEWGRSHYQSSWMNLCNPPEEKEGPSAYQVADSDSIRDFLRPYTSEEWQNTWLWPEQILTQAQNIVAQADAMASEKPTEALQLYEDAVNVLGESPWVQGSMGMFSKELRKFGAKVLVKRAKVALGLHDLIIVEDAAKKAHWLDKSLSEPSFLLAKRAEELGNFEASLEHMYNAQCINSDLRAEYDRLVERAKGLRQKTTETDSKKG